MTRCLTSTLLCAGACCVMAPTAAAQPELFAIASQFFRAGENFGERFGAAVASVEDVNGDGVREPVAGAFLHQEPNTRGGKVYVINSANAMNIGTFQTGDTLDSEWLGFALAGGDGHRLASGAPCFDGPSQGTGRAYIYDASIGQSIFTLDPPAPATFDYAGADVAIVDDVTNDGIKDFLVGAFGELGAGGPGNISAGRAHAYSGANGSRIWTSTGENDGDKYGNAVAVIGDITGNGFPDVAVGAPDFDGEDGAVGAGKVYLFEGFTFFPIDTIASDVAGAEFGFTIVGVGDINQDKTPDFAVGAPGVDEVILYSGADLSVIRTLAPGAPGRFGRSMALAGDLNGDDLEELAIGAPEFGNNIGRVYVYSPRAGSISYLVNGILDEQGEFGYDIEGIADFNGDDRPDIFVGAPGSDSNRGVAYVIESPFLTCVGDVDGDRFVNAVDLALLLGEWGGNGGLSDINGDGIVNGLDLPHLLGAWGDCPGV